MTDHAALSLETHLERFGLTEFRPGQEEIIAAVMSGRDCLVVMPTGGGKSLCYQLPAVARDGLTLVISPLIALMKDQVDQLTQRGIAATFINSTLEIAEQHDRLERIAAGEFDLVYVVPERFRSSRFLEAIGKVELSLLAVDEAHCISEWGHDFRPDYLRIGRFRRWIGNPQTIALTATATDQVRRDIIEGLDLSDPEVFITGFDRPNLFYQAETHASRAAKDRALVDFLNRHPGSGIIYSATRRKCEDVAELIASRTKKRSTVYHAGLTTEERHLAQEDFMADKVDVVVATNAFGMGIDKADVRFVVHYNFPGSLEAYYQEAGRAGRDGDASHCLMLYSPSDRYTQEFFIESAYPSRAVVQKVYRFLQGLEDDPIEMSQQDIKEQLGLEITSGGVGTCEKLFEKAGIIERLQARQNMAMVRLDSDVPTLVELLPQQATAQRSLMRAFENIVGPRRGENVYFLPHEVLAATDMDAAAYRRALNQLQSLEVFDYVPPFRGRAIRFLERDVPFDELDIDWDAHEIRRAAEYEKLERVIRFARSKNCRQEQILHYFGQTGSVACGHCDNCAARGVITAQAEAHHAQTAPQTHTRDDPVLLDVVRIILSGVARTRGRFGKNVVTQMLCGSTSKKLSKFKLDQLSTYGLLSHLKQTEVNELLDALIAGGYVVQEEIDRFRPIVQLTPRGTDLMTGRGALELRDPLSRGLLDRLRLPYHLASSSPSSEGTTSDGDDALSEALLQALKTWRNEEAKQSGMSPQYVLQNAVLKELATRRPQTAAELAEIKGIGDKKLDKYGEPILSLLASSEAGSEPSAKDATSGPAVEAPSTRGAAALGDPLSGQEVPPRKQPRHYWTWRLLDAGFTPEECAVIRNLEREVITDHAIAAVECGWPVDPGLFFSPEMLDMLEEVVGPDRPERIRPLLARLPAGTRYEDVQLFVGCREQRVSSDSE